MKVNTIKLIDGSTICDVEMIESISALSEFFAVREKDGSVKHINRHHVLWILPEKESGWSDIGISK